MAARLTKEVSQSTLGMRILVAALDSERDPREHRIVTQLREVFARYPVQAAQLRHAIGRVGVSSLRTYRTAHPMLATEPTAHGITARGDEFPAPMECGKPFLRIGVSQIFDHEDYHDVSNDQIYCLIQAEAQNGGEIRVTPKTPPLDQGADYLFSLESGVFWGQTELRNPGSDIQITYNCIAAASDQGYAALLKAIGDAAINTGGVIPGEAGWIVLAVGIVAELAAWGLSMETDEQLFNAQQTVPVDQDLVLTNGAYWTVRRSGTAGFPPSDWDWELLIKAWGCAQYGTL